MSTAQPDLFATPQHAPHHRLRRLRRFRFNLPQKIAALLLLAFLAQCFWSIHRQTLTANDYQYARCGREMWERPSPLSGYFTSCGNLHDGTLAYRITGLPLTLQRIVAGQSQETSTWEGRHELSYVLWWIRLPFVVAGLVLGGALWWVTRRLFGNPGGYVALAFYCFSPAILQASTQPNNEILTALGLFAAIYTAIGVAHAMQGPQRKWRPRILLLILAFGLAAAAHIVSLGLGIAIAFGLMLYLAEGRRSYILPILLPCLFGGFLLVFASYGFHVDAFSYLFRSSAARFWFSLDGARYFFGSLANAGLTVACIASLLLYVGSRRSRYFGNTAPLLLAVFLLLLLTTGVSAQPWLWAQPFLLAFIGGLFADALESRQHKIFAAATALLIAFQALLSVLSITGVLERLG